MHDDDHENGRDIMNDDLFEYVIADIDVHEVDENDDENLDATDL